MAETSPQTSADAFHREGSLGELAKHKHLQEVEMRLSNSSSQCQHSQLSKLCSKHGVVESLCRRQQHVPGVFQQYNQPTSLLSTTFRGQHPKLPESRLDCVTRSNDVCHRLCVGEHVGEQHGGWQGVRGLPRAPSQGCCQQRAPRGPKVP